MQFAPEDSLFSKGVLTQANSFVPTVSGLYQTSAPPFLESSSPPEALAYASGAAILENTSGTKKLFVGTNTKLQQWSSTTGGYTNRSGTTYGTGTAGYWSFAQFGDFHLAGNGVQIMQACTSGNFADATSTAPKAKFLLVHENAVIGLNLAALPDGWARSDTGNHLSWTASAANDADSGRLLGGVGGEITAATLFGNLAIAFKSGCMYGGQFIGSLDEKMRWTVIDPEVGCVGPRAHIKTEAGLFFVSKRDILLYDGSRPRSITRGIRRFLFAAMRFNRAATILSHDEAEKTIYVWIAGTGDFRPSGGYPYNYITEKWGGFVTVNDNADINPGGSGSIDCIVQNASYMDYQAVGGGLATNSFGQANVAFIHLNPNFGSSYLANFAHQPSAIFRNQQPAIQTGLMGDFFTDSTTNRVLPIMDDAALAKTAPTTISVAPYNSPNTPGNSVSAVVNSEGYGDIQLTTRLGQVAVAWATTCGQIAVNDILINPKASGTR